MKNPCLKCKNKGTPECPLFGTGIKPKQIIASNCPFFKALEGYDWLVKILRKEALSESKNI